MYSSVLDFGSLRVERCSRDGAVTFATIGSLGGDFAAQVRQRFMRSSVAFAVVICHVAVTVGSAFQSGCCLEAVFSCQVSAEIANLVDVTVLRKCRNHSKHVGCGANFAEDMKM